MTRWRALADELGNDPVLAVLTEPQAEADSIRATMRGAFRDLHVYLLARAKSA